MNTLQINRQTTTNLLPERSEAEWEKSRQEYIDAGYVECSIDTCNGLVSPAFIREIPSLGGLVALCPRTRVHSQQLGPMRLKALMDAFRDAGNTAAAVKPVEKTDEADGPTPNSTEAEAESGLQARMRKAREAKAAKKAQREAAATH